MASTALIVIFNLAFFIGSEGHGSEVKGEETVCPSRFEYNMVMLKKLTDVESDVRAVVHSLTKQILFCQNSDHPVPTPDTCPENSYQRGKSCYYVSDEIVTWGQAMRKCLSEFGGYLAVIDDEEENAYLQDIAKTAGSEADLWLGGTDAFKEGEWRWINTMTLFSSKAFSDWKSGQPDNGSGTEHCLALKGGFGFQWNDGQCYNRKKFICEKDLK